MGDPNIYIYTSDLLTCAVRTKWKRYGGLGLGPGPPVSCVIRHNNLIQGVLIFFRGFPVTPTVNRVRDSY